MGNRKGSELRERCLVFATRVLTFADEADTRGPARWTAFKQLCGSASSIGANLEEADAAQSRADFISKCCISLKEARETRYWLRLIQRTFFPHREHDLQPLIQETTELIAIFTTIIRKTSSNPSRS